MLSKSQARAFFILGTLLFTLIFIGLTVDTLRKIPAQTQSSNMTESVIRGKHLWDKNNCMGCHTLLGEGAYYAPELTKVYERRGAEWMKLFIKNPQAMYPGQRKMIQYNFTDTEIEELIAFFKWVGEMNLNGFPAKPNISIAPSVPIQTSAIPPIPAKVSQVCISCHIIGGKGGQIGPSLDGVGKRRDRDYLTRWLQNPAAVKPGALMPPIPLSEGELKEIVNFLSQI